MQQSAPLRSVGRIGLQAKCRKSTASAFAGGRRGAAMASAQSHSNPVSFTICYCHHSPGSINVRNSEVFLRRHLRPRQTQQAYIMILSASRWTKNDRAREEATTENVDLPFPSAIRAAGGGCCLLFPPPPFPGAAGGLFFFK